MYFYNLNQTKSLIYVYKFMHMLKNRFFYYRFQ